MFLAGDRGPSFLSGWTQVAFGGQPNDGVATVDSQLDLAGGEKNAMPAATRLVYPWDHFTIGRGIRVTRTPKAAAPETRPPQLPPWEAIVRSLCGDPAMAGAGIREAATAPGGSSEA